MGLKSVVMNNPPERAAFIYPLTFLAVICFLLINRWFLVPFVLFELFMVVVIMMLRDKMKVLVDAMYDD